MNRWRQFFILMRRESWEYRDWWTYVLGATLLLGMGALCGLSWQTPLLDPQTRALRDSLFLRWLHGLFLVGGSIMALSHAAHGVFDERQDRSIGFWQSWPVPEHIRLLAKSTAIALGWPLVAAFASTVLTLFCMAKEIGGQEYALYTNALATTWLGMMQSCLFTAVWSWPLICAWLWCSAHAKKSPWAWGMLAGGGIYMAGQGLAVDTLPLSLAIALGPILPALTTVLGEPHFLPWPLVSWGWFGSFLVGTLALFHAGKSIGDRANP